MQIQSVIGGCRLFAQLDAKAVLRLAAMAQQRDYARGQSIFREGDPCPGVFIVGSGTVRIYKIGAGGKEHVLHLAEPGMTFAEVAAIGGMPCPAFAEAVQPTQCVLLPYLPFRRALDTDHQLCRQLLQSMAGWVRQLVGLLEDVVLRDAIGRLAHYLLDAADGPNHQVVLPTIKRHVASHLDLTSETLSRTLRRLTDQGIIQQIDSRTVRILNVDALRDVMDQFTHPGNEPTP